MSIWIWLKKQLLSLKKRYSKIFYLKKSKFSTLKVNIQNNKYSATIIGSYFTLFCLAASITFVVPFLFMVPLCLLFENIFSAVFSNENYPAVGNAVVAALGASCLLVSLVFFLRARKQLMTTGEIKKGSIKLFMFIQLFIVHPLVFYLVTSQDWSWGSDGQFIFGINGTCPKSSFAFIVFGILIDVIKSFFKKPTDSVTI